MRWSVRFVVAALVFLVGVVLSPLRAVAAVPVRIAYDAAVWPTSTMRVEAGPSPRSEPGGAPKYVYGDAPDVYVGTTKPCVTEGAGALLAYDGALELTERREVAYGVIYAAPAATTAAGALPVAETRGNEATLARHFADHGADFGSTSAEAYAEDASRFLQRSQAEGLPTKIDANGVIRVYDPSTNTFGAFNPNGTTRTFFSPSSPSTYWGNQPGAAPWTPGSLE